ncbi:hypothetical protein ABW20_dc0101842 [Dactylellina cionopaga]|nr:hypothetical protein ABW20_dc0101842 [Dactylellina cionopaga]
MYKNGSLLSGASGVYHDHMAVPALRHLGVRFADIWGSCSAEKEKGESITDYFVSAPATVESLPFPEEEEEELRSKRPRYNHRASNSQSKSTTLYSCSQPQGLLLMTSHDRAKAISMLHRGRGDDETASSSSSPASPAATVSAEYADDLRTLLFVGYKAEIQVLGDRLVRYLDEKLGGQRVGLAA